MNIVDPVIFHCRRTPTEAALAAPGTTLNIMSYARLERSINSICRKALSSGLKRGDIVALYFEDRLLHAAMILALTRVGIVTVSGFNPKLPQGLRVNAVITDLNFAYQAERVIPADSNWTTGDDRPIDEAHIHQARPEELCRIILTSGSTGEPKAVAITHGMLAARIARHQYMFGNRAPYCSRTYLDLGLASSLGFQVLIAMLWRGGTLFMPGVNDQATINAFEFYKIQNMVSSPGGLSTMLQVYDARIPSQSRLDTVFSGGSLLPTALSERVRARICSNLITAYGSTETSMVATVPAHVVANVPGGVGYVLPGIEVQIVDSNGLTLPRGKEGIVRIRSDFGVPGYYGDPEQASTSFREGWFFPGDIGRLTADNLLVITGREKAVINLGGDKLKPELVEEVLMAHPSVAHAAVFAVAGQSGVDELWAVVVPRGTADISALKTYCKTKLPDIFIPVNFAVTPDLPLNAMGKVERQRLSEIAKKK